MGQQAGAQADTRLYYIVHKALRSLTNRFADSTEKLPPSALQPVIGSRWAFYAGILHHHHHDEDDSILPALLTMRPDLEALVNTLEEDHRQLSGSIDTASAAVAAFEQ